MAKVGRPMKKVKEIPEEELIKIVLDEAKNDETFGRTRLKVRKYFYENYDVTDPWELLGLTWAEFRRKCGITPIRSHMALINQASKHASKDKIKKGSNERLSWGGIYSKIKDKGRFKTIMSAGDFHDLDVDPFALRMFLLKVNKVQPDVICIHGDLFDAFEFSKHVKDPRDYNLGDRIDKARDILRLMRKASPNSQIDLLEGNHEARIHRHLLEQSPAMAHLLNHVHGMKIREMLGLDEYEVNYIAKGDLHAFTDAQLKKAVTESEAVYWDCVWIRHHPPKKENISMPGVNGHHHRYFATTHFNPAFGAFQWHQLGGMCKRVASYTDGRRWNTGFILGIVDTKKKRVIWDYTDVGNEMCLIGGQFHQRKKDEYY